jgi:predicted GNAT family acetyltransferase
MTTHSLDRPIWHALSKRLSHLAVGSARALRFAPDIGPLAAARDDSPESLQALSNLVAEHGNVVLLQVGESPLPPNTTAEMTALGVQMVAQNLAPLEPDHRVERLTEADAREMLELATLTKPGPFKARTHQLGGFWGIKENGKLVAMAGERMKLTGFTEVSGVCTHPDVRGRGYAGLLSRTVATQIQKRGETPMLHAFASNTAAVSLYESLGFVLRCHVTVTMLAPSG